MNQKRYHYEIHGILWRKKKMEILQHISKNSVSKFVEKYMKCGQWVVAVLASYIKYGQWLQVKPPIFTEYEAGALTT
jgi:hypothetical protein